VKGAAVDFETSKSTAQRVKNRRVDTLFVRGASEKKDTFSHTTVKLSRLFRFDQ
jgi:hypothetical protein